MQGGFRRAIDTAKRHMARGPRGWGTVIRESGLWRQSPFSVYRSILLRDLSLWLRKSAAYLSGSASLCTYSESSQQRPKFSPRFVRSSHNRISQTGESERARCPALVLKLSDHDACGSSRICTRVYMDRLLLQPDDNNIVPYYHLPLQGFRPFLDWPLEPRRGHQLLMTQT